MFIAAKNLSSEEADEEENLDTNKTPKIEIN